MSDVNDKVVIVVPAVLGATLVVLAVSVVVFVTWLTYRKKLCCFARAERKTQPLPFHTPAEIESRLQHKRRLRGFKGHRKSKLDHNSIRKSLLSDQPDGEVQNPLVGAEELEEDFTNPVFDAEAARYRDAATTIQCWWRMLKYRILYLQLREAALLVQAFWRGKQCRKMFPELRKRKLQEHQRKKSIGVFNKKGRLASKLGNHVDIVFNFSICGFILFLESVLHFYDVKGFGFAEVEQLYGLETIREATSQLKKMYSGKGKMKLKVLISVHGIKLFDAFTLAHYATVKMSSISFCTMDPKNKRVFAFINRKKKKNFCHVFQCQEGDALKMVETMAEAFECTFKQQEKLQNQMESQQALSGSQLGTPLLGQKRPIAEIPRGVLGSQSSQCGSHETLSSVGSKAAVRHNSKSLKANVRSSTPPLSGSRNRSNQSSVDNSPLTTAKLVHEKKRNSQLSVKSNTHTVAPQVGKQQQQKSNLVSHNQNAPQPNYLSDLQKAMDDLRTLSS